MSASTNQQISSFKKAAHAIEVGIAMGVAGFIVNAFVAGEIAGLQYQREEDSLFLQILVMVLPAFVIAPATAWLVGLLVEGPRWKIAVSQNLTLQGSILLIASAGEGIIEYLTPLVGLIALTLFAVGTVFSALAFTRAHRRRKPEAPKAAELAAIDFASVKKQDDAAAAAAAVPPAPVPVPAAESAAPAAAATPASASAPAASAEPALASAPAPTTPAAPAAAAAPATAPAAADAPAAGPGAPADPKPQQ